jgi:hypothetical protein
MREPASIAHVSLLLGLLFDPEDGSDMFFHIIG